MRTDLRTQLLPGWLTCWLRSALLLQSSVIFAFLTFVPWEPILAQTALPDAGSVQQQFRRPPPELPAQQTPLVDQKEAPAPASGATIEVRAFRFSGNTLLSDGELEQVVAEFTGRELSFAELQQAAAAVGEAYRAGGWLARVFVPRQEVVDGIVTLEIVEARFGQLLESGESPERLAPGVAEGFVLQAQPSGRILDLGRLDRALLLIDDLPGVTATGNLAAGDQAGETDLLLTLADEPLIIGQVAVDNFGARSTGEERASLDVRVNSPLGRGDLLRSNLTISEGTRYLWMDYGLPLGFSGLRAGIDASYLDYEVVTSEFASLDLEGDSVTWGINLWYPVIREADRNLYAGVDYENKRYDNRSNVGTTSDYRIDNARFTLTGNLFDRLGGGGANFMNLALTVGDVDLGTLDAGETAGLNGSFAKFNYLISRQQALVDKLSLFASLSGQVADSNLDSSEKFYLGGPYGVRAFPVNEGGGDEAVLAQVELRYRVRPDLVLAGFFDWGQVTQNKDNSSALASPNTYELDGVGMDLSWTGPKGLILGATYSYRLGDNPNPDANGNDQDGSLDKHRFWLSASLPF